MALPEYLTNFIIIRPQGDQVGIYFDDFTWDGHTPVSHKVLLYQILLAKWEKDKEKHISRILNNKKYFRIWRVSLTFSSTFFSNASSFCIIS